MKPENNLEDSLEKLAELGTDPDEFKIWLKSFLTNNISHPLPGFSLTEYPHEYLSRIYESTDNERFKERLRGAVAQFFKNWNINARNESYEYYSSLLNLIADLENESRDVQTLILEVIAGMEVPGAEKPKKRLMDLVKKYIIDPSYTPLCFTIAWQTQYESAIEYMSRLLECSRKRSFDIHETIEDFLIGCRVDIFKELVVPMLEELKFDNLRGYFLEILSDLGVKIYISDYRFEPDHILMTWEVYGQPVVLQETIYYGNVHYGLMNSIEEFPPTPIGVKKGDEEFLEFAEEFLEKAA
jgi:hypothetical protein